MRIASRGEPFPTAGMSRIRRDLMSPWVMDKWKQRHHVEAAHTDRRTAEDSDNLAGGATVVRYRQHVAGVGTECRAYWVASCASRDNDIRARLGRVRCERRRSLRVALWRQGRVWRFPVSGKVEYRGTRRGIVWKREVHGWLHVWLDQKRKILPEKEMAPTRSGAGRHRHTQPTRPPTCILSVHSYHLTTPASFLRPPLHHSLAHPLPS